MKDQLGLASGRKTDTSASDSRFALAAEHHRAGRLGQAEALCREILAVVPRHPEALNLLGAIASQTGHHGAAIELFERAIEVQPGAGHSYYNLGLVLQGLGRFEQAAQAFEHAASLLPESADLANGLAVLYLLLGRNAEAATRFERVLALRPDFAEAACNLGVALQNQGLAGAATERFRQALQLRPDYADAARNLGVALHQQGHTADAIAALERAVAIRPDDAAAIDPLVAIRHNFGVSLLDQDRFDEAADQFRRVLEVRPESADSWYELGKIMSRQGQADAALDCHERAVTLNPDHADAVNCLAMAWKGRGETGHALDLLDRVVALEPDNADMVLNRGIVRLLSGDFEAGWVDYEARWRTEQTAASRRAFDLPVWDGTDGEGRTILLWPEQGLGDTLQFCRYAPMLVERGWRVLLEAPSPLARLLRSLSGVTIVPVGGGAEAHCHCALVGLPRLFGTRLENIPARVPYLAPPSDEVRRWRNLMTERDGMNRARMKVGLAWAGTPGHLSKVYMTVDAARSISLDRISPLLSVPDICFVSLQKELKPGEEPAGQGLLDVMGGVEDFADTAAIVAQLDLVVTVDTSVVHLAGALGKPVWLLNRYDPCWRWLLRRDDSPWYPTLRQFRQPEPGDWNSVVLSVKAALEARLSDAV